MGTVVTFQPARKPRRTSVRAEAEATILLFMGVRYVRDIEPVLDAEPASRPERNHDLIVRERA